MSNRPSPATPALPAPPDDPGGELQRRFGDRWQVEQPAPGIWSATRRSADGRSIRCIIGPSAGELLAKLETVELVEP